MEHDRRTISFVHSGELAGQAVTATMEHQSVTQGAHWCWESSLPRDYMHRASRAMRPFGGSSFPSDSCRPTTTHPWGRPNESRVERWINDFSRGLHTVRIGSSLPSAHNVHTSCVHESREISETRFESRFCLHTLLSKIQAHTSCR